MCISEPARTILPATTPQRSQTTWSFATTSVQGVSVVRPSPPRVSRWRAAEGGQCSALPRDCPGNDPPRQRASGPLRRRPCECVRGPVCRGTSRSIGRTRDCCPRPDIVWKEFRGRRNRRTSTAVRDHPRLSPWVVASIAPSTPPTRRLPPAWTSPVGTVEPAVETEAVSVAAAAAQHRPEVDDAPEWRRRRRRRRAGHDGPAGNPTWRRPARCRRNSGVCACVPTALPVETSARRPRVWREVPHLQYTEHGIDRKGG